MVINAYVELALDPKSVKVVADGVKHDAWVVESVECLVDNMSQQVNNAKKKKKLKVMSEQIQSP